ncbi:sigma factor-like helix-turn-helix DNA-binding protein [Streptosporangium sp. NPDC005286]|uniref:sigma factor-like helix-turn-helix DNA-binding protein n=1 Tax=Streptosporangium sp. NPDC005286 TaxID=3154463 RepID=UPI0033B1420E
MAEQFSPHPLLVGYNDFLPNRLVSASNPEDDVSEHERRLAADTELLQRLEVVNFSGEPYRVFEEDLVRYAVRRYQQLLSTGQVFQMCQKRRIGLPRQKVSAHDREDIAEDTVARALPGFRKTLMSGAWRRGGGASLSDFFVGFAMMHFANAYRAWLRRQSPDDLAYLDAYEDLEHARLASPQPSPETIVTQRLTIMEGLRDLPAPLAAALALSEDGYSHSEIAEATTTTSRSVEGMLHRHRAKLKADREKEGR